MKPQDKQTAQPEWPNRPGRRNAVRLYRPHPNKLELLDHVFGQYPIRSFADLGGIGRVDAGYTFYLLDKYAIDRAWLVDVRSNPRVLQRADRYPQLHVLKADFACSETAAQIDRVDAILMFGILLHQAAPSWTQVLELYAPRTDHLLIYNPQFQAADGHSVRLLELGEQEYFSHVPYSRDHPLGRRLFDAASEYASEDCRAIWQWGITDQDLVSKLRSLGFELQYDRNWGPFPGLVFFENRAFAFQFQRPPTEANYNQVTDRGL